MTTMTEIRHTYIKEGEINDLHRSYEKEIADLKKKIDELEKKLFIYSPLIDQMNEIYQNTEGDKKLWVNDNWKSILNNMTECGWESINGWNA